MHGIFRFEDIGDDLPLLPLAARRALDAAGRKLSLAAWQGLSLEKRRVIVEQGVAHHTNVDTVREAITDADPTATIIAELTPADLDGRPDTITTMSDARWSELSQLERFALRHLSRKKKARLDEALAEIAPNRPTHLDAQGRANMVDVGDKPISHRRAVVRAQVRMRPETLAMVQGDGAPKGDVLAAARIAGIMGSKKTSELIPLCHPIGLDRVRIAFDVDQPAGLITITATADAHDRTGVEMEAMTAASVAALTIYDMLKGVERGIAIEQIVLVEKLGGRSGHYRRDPADSSP